MKKLWIVRHAKSSWSDFGLADHDRPLNERGKRDAPFMGKLIDDQYPVPTHLLTSTAKRARATCKAFRKAMGIDKEFVTRFEQLYHASMGDCLRVIHSIDDDIEIAAIFGHNPTFTYLIEELTGAGPDNLPTCGCALISSDTEHWATFETAPTKLDVLLYPKQFRIE
jgi:phosphohistidine phosphatase